jgi:hypothetical protein
VTNSKCLGFYSDKHDFKENASKGRSFEWSIKISLEVIVGEKINLALLQISKQ